jgi:hypothetical protein
VPFTKRFLNLILFLQFVLLVFSQVGLVQEGFNWVAYWLILSVQIPTAFAIYQLSKARNSADFHSLSSVMKWIMVGGIGSMLVIWIQFRFPLNS